MKGMKRGKDALVLEIVPPSCNTVTREATVSSATPRNYGDTWDMDDFEALVEALAESDDDAVVADAIGRDVEEIERASVHLMPEGTVNRVPATDRLRYLRGVLLDPDFPWIENIATSHRGFPPPWPKGGDRTLIEFWDQGDPLEFIAESLGVSEVQVAERCVRLGIASNFAEVVETVGPGKDGVVETRGRMSFERDETALDVYIDVDDCGEVSVYLAPPGESPLRFHQRRNDGSEHQWVVVRGALCGEVVSSSPC